MIQLFFCLPLQIPATEPLMSAGLDSLAAVELRDSLQAAFDVQLPATVIFDYPSIDALARHMAELLAEQGRAAASREPAGEARSTSNGVGQTLASITATLQDITAGMLGWHVPTDQPLMEAGLDSLGEWWPTVSMLLCPRALVTWNHLVLMQARWSFATQSRHALCWTSLRPSCLIIRRCPLWLHTWQAAWPQ